jgi:LmbE family N-acetylglucosaminyl deacetylase
MNSSLLQRRTFLKLSLANLAALPFIPVSERQSYLTREPIMASRSISEPLKVVCVGAHPDDPESGCGGTLARYAGSGHRVTIIYLTRGESGIPGKSPQESAAIRSAEAQEACQIIGAKPLFAGQIDGNTRLDNASTFSVIKLLSEEKPDVVFTHWPIDTNWDHQVAAMLTLRTYSFMQGRFHLYFYEVNAGSQTMNFKPTDYVDITSTREKKKAALFIHKSQNGEKIYRDHHELMENFRGREAGAGAAEAFVRLARESNSGKLPGL